MAELIKFSHNTGEVDPQLLGRVDFARYFNAALRIENFMITPYGGLEFRAGTQFANEVKDSSVKTKIVPFVFSVDITYFLEFGNLYIRFYRDRTQLESGGSPYEIVSPYQTADLDELQFFQAHDVMYIISPDHKIRLLSRLGDTNWTLAEDDIKNGPFIDKNSDTTHTLSVSFPAWATGQTIKINDTRKVLGANKFANSYSPVNLNYTAGPPGNSAVDNGDGTVDIPSVAHGLTAGMYVQFLDTVNYTGPVYLVETGTTADLIRITETYMPEVFSAPDQFQRVAVPVDKGGGFVGIPIDAHGVADDQHVEFTGWVNYNGTFRAHDTSTTNELVIASPFVLEYLDGTEKINKADYYTSLTNHTTGTANPTPPGNTTDWESTIAFTGEGATITSNTALFESGHVGSLFLITHPRSQEGMSGRAGMNYIFPAQIVPKNTAWSMITSGTWEGTLNIERRALSKTNHAWQVIQRYKSDTSPNGRNVSVNEIEIDDDALYRINFVERLAGTLVVDFNTDNYFIDGIIRIETFNSDTSVTGTILRPLADIISTDDWAEGAYSDVKGWPRGVGFYDKRLVTAGPSGNPTKVYTSKSDDYNNYETGTLADDAIIRRLEGDRINRIQWVIGVDDLVVATAGGIWRVGKADLANPMSPTNVESFKQNNDGSDPIQPLFISNAVIYVCYKGCRVLELLYRGDTLRYGSRDLFNVSRHFTEDYAITHLSFIQEPYPIILALRADGQIVVGGYKRDEQFMGWGRWITNGEIESVATTPGDPEDEVAFIVKRTIDGNVKRYVEFKRPQRYGYRDIKNAWYLDSALEFDGGASVAITDISQAVLATVTSNAHGLLNDQFVRIENVVGMIEANTVWQIVYIDANSYSLKDPDTGTPIDSTSWTAYTSGGTGQRVTKIVGNLAHLDSTSVKAFGDGQVLGDFTVAAGQVTLDDYVNRVLVGLSYTGIVQPVSPDVGGAAFYGTTRKISRIAMKFYRTASAQYGTDLADMLPANFDDDNLIWGEDSAIYDQFLRENLESDWERESNFYIQQNEPLPMNLLGWKLDMEKGGL